MDTGKHFYHTYFLESWLNISVSQNVHISIPSRVEQIPKLTNQNSFVW